MARPPTGIGHYLRDIVYGALDGAITTMAVIAGTAGASLGVRVALILGLANLVADGISMGASNYLGPKSELEQKGESVRVERPWRHGLVTIAAFVVAGAVPLAAYLLPWPGPWRTPAALIVAAAVFYIVGAARAPFLRRSSQRCGLEMLVIGVGASLAAYVVGALADRWI